MSAGREAGSAPRIPLIEQSACDDIPPSTKYSPLTADGLKALETVIALVTKSHSDLAGKDKKHAPDSAENIECKWYYTK